ELFEIDRELHFELALIDRATLQPARDVAEHVVRVDQIVRDAVLGEALADAAGIAVVRETGRNRRTGDAVRVRPGILGARRRGRKGCRECEQRILCAPVPRHSAFAFSHFARPTLTPASAISPHSTTAPSRRIIHTTGPGLKPVHHGRKATAAACPPTVAPPSITYL